MSVTPVAFGNLSTIKRSEPGSYAVEVHFELPGVVNDALQLALWTWTLVLGFKVQHLAEITRLASGRPFRWLLYLSSCIMGTELGTLYRVIAGSDPVPVQLDGSLDASPSATIVLIFVVPATARDNLKIVEPGLCSNKLGGSGSTHVRKQVQDDVHDRDEICVASRNTLMPVMCTAAHLLPHIKSDAVCLFLFPFARLISSSLSGPSPTAVLRRSTTS